MSASLEALPASLIAQLDAADPARTIAAFVGALGGPAVFTTSFGVEDQAITHMIAEAGLPVEIVTLDTGRLFPETYDVWTATERRYGIRIGAAYPQASALEALVERQGVNGFRDSVAARKACCAARKVEPLGRALAGAAGWITGLRADQSANRAATALVEWDAAHGLVKLNPLAGWSRADAQRFAQANALPLNALHARGFPSIGCAPCTRAVRPDEPERAGRWWWEQESGQDNGQECGLHVGPDGVLRRAAAAGEARP